MQISQGLKEILKNEDVQEALKNNDMDKVIEIICGLDISKYSRFGCLGVLYELHIVLRHLDIDAFEYISILNRWSLVLLDNFGKLDQYNNIKIVDEIYDRTSHSAVKLPESIEQINANAFYKVKFYSGLYLPIKNLVGVDKSAFNGFAGTIYVDTNGSVQEFTLPEQSRDIIKYLDELGVEIM